MNRCVSIFVSFFLVAVTLTIEPPTHYTNGLPITEPLGGKLYCAQSGQTGYPLAFDLGASMVGDMSLLLASEGDYRCVGAVYVLDSVRDESGVSNAVDFFYPGAIPGAPINLRVEF